MKLIYLIFLAFVAVSANVLPVKRSHQQAINQHGEMIWLDELVNPVPSKCDYSCTDRDTEVCAHNGQCLQVFVSECTMAAYNCRNPRKPFKIVKDIRCTQGYVPHCSREERRELGMLV